MQNKKTLVMGASEKEDRYSNKAIRMLREYGHETVALGNKEGKVLDVPVLSGQIPFGEIHTVSMYLGKANQKQVEDYIILLNPKRVIFNPGAENQEFREKLETLGIEGIEACTLVLLRTGQF